MNFPQHPNRMPVPDALPDAGMSVHRSQLAVVARFTLLEAWRSRLPWLLAAAVVCTMAAAVLASGLAITESSRFRSTLFAGGLRFAWVFILAVYVIGSLSRELNERGFETALSLELTRSTWVLGKLAGFVLLAVIGTLALYPLLAALSAPAAAAAWSLSLMFELSIVIAAATFFTLSLSSLPAAAALTGAFYLLARAIDALLLIAGGSPLLAPGPWRDFARLAIEALAWLLPRLARFAPGDWLVSAPPAPGLLAIQGLQAIAFVLLLGVAASVDFHRRDL